MPGTPDAIERTYAELLDAPPDSFERPGVTFVATRKRTTGVGGHDRWVRHV